MTDIGRVVKHRSKLYCFNLGFDSQLQPLNGSRFNPLDSSIEPPYFAAAFDWLIPHLAKQRLELARQSRLS